MRTVAAVDLGASSGRVVRGVVDDGAVHIEEVHRFPNGPVHLRGTLHWDVPGLYREVLTGLKLAGELDSIGIDSWAVDYGLLDAGGRLLGNPVHYRDSRTDGSTPRDGLYEINGLQFQPFNTMFQLMAEPLLPQASQLLLIPDLLSYWLTGERGAEYTNATTTGLIDVRTGQWSPELTRDLPAGLLPDLRHPGDSAGTYNGVPVTAVGSHDTASAVVAVPAETDRFAYISCGTWSLVGVELSKPVLSPESKAANFTNEGGVDGTIRYLRNVMGLWLLQECLRCWDAELEPLLREARQAEGSVFDPNDPVFLPPGDMPARIQQACGRVMTRAEVVRSVLDSLALAHRDAVNDAQRLSGKEVEVVHIVGGGSHNELLCQLTADACGLPVVAGPAEATALGNVLVQARAVGAAHGTLADLRKLVRESQPLRRYLPRATTSRYA
ncbi:rhamnulokinase family protein [Lentzea sp. BCCO 10_0856]|uniref:Rhamnulokinase family protein n=1 Tax=Lentzea miocenica TaxID=3095431 RepID=A0ABU4TES4_9PSEU|nr:rhamnulokinase family protein [Lentzea sp. BCCO 10_0856]MDX8036656.1 rhamnulokinase family protein [Lentzea sp. BCCO 10_0856]